MLYRKLKNENLHQWIERLNKILQKDFNENLYTLIIDLTLLRYLMKRDKEGNPLIADEKTLCDVLDLHLLKSASLVPARESIYGFFDDEKIFQTYIYSVDFQGLNEMIKVHSLEDFKNFIRAYVAFMKHHRIHYMSNGSNLDVRWLNFLEIIDNIDNFGEGQYNESMQNEINRFTLSNIDSEDINSLTCYLRAWAISCRLIKIDLTRMSIEKPESYRPSLQEDLRVAASEAELDFDESTLFPKTAKSSERSVQFFGFCYDNAKKSAYLQHAVDLREARLGDLFDEENVLTFWAITCYNFNLETPLERINRFYRLLGKIGDEEEIDLGIWAKILEKLSEHAEKLAVPRNALQAHEEAKAEKMLINEFERLHIKELRAPEKPLSSILKKDSSEAQSPKKKVNFA